MQLNITLEKLLEITGGQSSIDPTFFISGLSSLKNARAADVSVVFDPEEGGVFEPVSLHDIKLCRAGVIIASKALTDDKNYVVVEDPVNAFQKLSSFMSESPATGVHKSAVLDETVILEDKVSIGANTVVAANSRIGERTVVGDLSYIGKNVRIGINVKLYPGVKILDNCVIGDNTIIHSGSVIGSDGFGYRSDQNRMKKVPQVGIVNIGRDVEIGSNVCIDRATMDETIIGDGVKIDNQVHIAHNVTVGPHTAIIAQTGIAGGATIGAGCMIGGQVGIKDHVSIGDGVKVVSKTGVLRNVKSGDVIAGIPAMPFAKWKKVVIALTQLPEMVKLGKQLKDANRKSVWGRLFGKK